ncbi:MAG: tetraacyldisaccharide 4'-kinase [Planctomycetota bacterium]
MDESSLFRRIAAGRTGPWSWPIRGMFRIAELGYAAAVAARNRRFDRGEGVLRVGVPVVSVGNLTVGGTGKTPMVIDILLRLARLGYRPAVVARGYKSPSGDANDEERLIRRRVPDVRYVADADRARGAHRAVTVLGADAIVLDDGFQHRRLARDLDMVLIDATCPLGHGSLLPRGLLREPMTSLGRAGVVILTRCDQVDGAVCEDVERRVRRHAPQATILRCRHRAAGVTTLAGEESQAALRGQRVVLCAGIANPAAFRRTVVDLGALVVAEYRRPDHHAYTVRDARRLCCEAGWPAHDLVVTTEKDAVKLARMPEVDSRRFMVVRVSIDFEGDGGTMLDAVLGRMLKTS